MTRKWTNYNYQYKGLEFPPKPADATTAENDLNKLRQEINARYGSTREEVLFRREEGFVKGLDYDYIINVVYDR